MSKTHEAVNALQDGIIMAIEKMLDQAKFDKTVHGRIVEMISANKYKVLINGNNYLAKSTLVHNINDTVNVMIPQNNYSEMFIITDGNTGGGTGKGDMLKNIYDFDNDGIVNRSDISIASEAIDVTNNIKYTYKLQNVNGITQIVYEEET